MESMDLETERNAVEAEEALSPVTRRRCAIHLDGVLSKMAEKGKLGGEDSQL